MGAELPGDERISPGHGDERTARAVEDPVPAAAEDSVEDDMLMDGHVLDPRVHAAIGEKLREMYDGYLHDPIPDRIMSLLEKLDAVAVDEAGPGARARDTDEPSGA